MKACLRKDDTSGLGFLCPQGFSKKSTQVFVHEALDIGYGDGQQPHNRDIFPLADVAHVPAEADELFPVA